MSNHTVKIYNILYGYKVQTVDLCVPTPFACISTHSRASAKFLFSQLISRY